jgi:hypothetical protein
MRILADFLAQERAPILELFTTRVQTIAPRALTTSQLADHVPQILHELERTLRASSDPADCIMATSPSAEAHGRQRLRLGYDLVAVVREYGVLRDCILEHLEVRAVMPSLRELRILSDGVSAATADSIQEYVDHRGDEATSERRHLLDLFDQAPGFVCFLRGRELVLLLDNFEHLLDAAPTVADLLATAAGLRVLATSRAPLRISGEGVRRSPRWRARASSSCSTRSSAPARRSSAAR